MEVSALAPRSETAAEGHLYSLPGAVGMFGLSLGVQKISDVLPGAVYALLSGLNAATVGLVALAAVQVSEYSTHVNFHYMLTKQACRESDQRQTVENPRNAWSLCRNVL